MLFCPRCLRAAGTFFVMLHLRQRAALFTDRLLSASLSHSRTHRRMTEEADLLPFDRGKALAVVGPGAALHAFSIVTTRAAAVAGLFEATSWRGASELRKAGAARSAPAGPAFDGGRSRPVGYQSGAVALRCRQRPTAPREVRWRCGESMPALHAWHRGLEG